jgi:hypothetical protein
VADPESDIHILVTLVELVKKLYFSQQNTYNFLLVIQMGILRNTTETEQELILETHSDEAISSDSESELDEDTVTAGHNNNVNRKR